MKLSLASEKAFSSMAEANPAPDSERALRSVIHEYENVKPGDLYPYQPIRFIGAHLDDLLAFCVTQEVSDIKFYTHREALVKVHGQTYPVTDRVLTDAEVADFAVKLYGNNSAITLLSSGKDIDVQYEVKANRHTRLRFRVSITSMQVRGEHGIRITLRSLPFIPPKAEEMGVPTEIIEGFLPSNGLVIVTGPTGSGKSTLLASVIRHLLEKKNGNLDILEFAAPIEFVYDEIDIDPSSLIAQSEVPRDIRSFALAVRNALRNNPDVISIGEARDTETLTAVIEAALTGHIVYSTLHTNSVAATIKRITIGASESETISFTDVIESLRLVVSQRLEKNPKGGRTALREYKVFTQEERDLLMNSDSAEVASLVQTMVDAAGVSFVASAKAAFEAGLIYERDYNKIKQESRAS